MKSVRNDKENSTLDKVTNLDIWMELNVYLDTRHLLRNIVKKTEENKKNGSQNFLSVTNQRDTCSYESLV
jgi:hypothetical protein